VKNDYCCIHATVADDAAKTRTQSSRDDMKQTNEPWLENPRTTA
jgi:hypothetical protein